MLRSRRILVPLMAWALAAGQQAAIDGAYMLVILASIFAGTCFLGRIMVRQGLSVPLAGMRQISRYSWRYFTLQQAGLAYRRISLPMG